MAAEVLVVEDEPDIRNLIVLHLSREGFRCRTAKSGPEALREARAATPDLVILDLMLPDLDGLEVCRRLRSDAATATIPIIMLTAKADEVDRVVGLEIGADDYVVKPFSPKELIARIRAVLRPRRAAAEARVLRAGAVTIDPMRHQVDVAGGGGGAPPQGIHFLPGPVGGGRPRRVPRRPPPARWGYPPGGGNEPPAGDVRLRRVRAQHG